VRRGVSVLFPPQKHYRLYECRVYIWVKVSGFLVTMEDLFHWGECTAGTRMFKVI
jgi:hypothetical protein